MVREDADPALARLRWSLWLASTAAAALFAGTVAAAAGAGPRDRGARVRRRRGARERAAVAEEGSPGAAADLPRGSRRARRRAGRRGRFAWSGGDRGVAGRHRLPRRRPAPADTGAVAHRRDRRDRHRRRCRAHDQRLAGLRHGVRDRDRIRPAHHRRRPAAGAHSGGPAHRRHRRRRDLAPGASPPPSATSARRPASPQDSPSGWWDAAWCSSVPAAGCGSR